MEIKNCPFCGGVAHTREIMRWSWKIACNDCGIELPVYEGSSFTSEENAIKKWNERWYTKELSEAYDRGCRDGYDLACKIDRP